MRGQNLMRMIVGQMTLALALTSGAYAESAKESSVDPFMVVPHEELVKTLSGKHTFLFLGRHQAKGKTPLGSKIYIKKADLERMKYYQPDPKNRPDLVRYQIGDSRSEADPDVDGIKIFMLADGTTYGKMTVDGNQLGFANHYFIGGIDIHFPGLGAGLSREQAEKLMREYLVKLGFKIKGPNGDLYDRNGNKTPYTLKMFLDDYDRWNNGFDKPANNNKTRVRIPRGGGAGVPGLDFDYEYNSDDSGAPRYADPSKAPRSSTKRPGSTEEYSITDGSDDADSNNDDAADSRGGSRHPSSSGPRGSRTTRSGQDSGSEDADLMRMVLKLSGLTPQEYAEFLKGGGASITLNPGDRSSTLSPRDQIIAQLENLFKSKGINADKNKLGEIADLIINFGKPGSTVTKADIIKALEGAGLTNKAASDLVINLGEPGSGQITLNLPGFSVVGGSNGPVIEGIEDWTHLGLGMKLKVRNPDGRLVFLKIVGNEAKNDAGETVYTKNANGDWVDKDGKVIPQRGQSPSAKGELPSTTADSDLMSILIKLGIDPSSVVKPGELKNMSDADIIGLILRDNAKQQIRFSTFKGGSSAKFSADDKEIQKLIEQVKVLIKDN